MEDPWLEPQSDEEVASSRRQLEAWGAVFDGSAWAMLLPAAEPLEETVVLVAATAEIYRRSSGRPTGLNVQVLQFGDDFMVRLEIMLFDDPAAPLVLAPLLNPVAADTRGMLGRLADQDLLPLQFVDQGSARAIGQRIMPFAQDARDAIRVLLRHTQHRRVTAARWQQMVAAAQRTFAG